jgi:transcription elongation factor Elf1
MSFLESVIKRFANALNDKVTCPICGEKSSQPASKIRQGQALICPKCKSLFVVPD